MTREERDVLAKACAYAANVRRHDVTDDLQAAQLDAAAAELRKTCATCQHFRPTAINDKPTGFCRELKGWPERDGWTIVPADGSGHCHRYESQPAGKAQD